MSAEKKIWKADKRLMKDKMERLDYAHWRAKKEYKRIKKAQKAGLGRFAMEQSGIFNECLSEANRSKQKNERQSKS